MKCHVLSRDLMFSSQVQGAARSAGLDLVSAANQDAVERNIASGHTNDEASTHVVVVDLTTPGLDLATAVKQWRKIVANPTKIIAIGPHVQAPRLDAAAEAGCDYVWTKGQASRDLTTLLQDLSQDD